LDPKFSYALYILGWLYEHAQGVDKDIAKAKEYYEASALEGNYDAKKQLFILKNPNFTTAAQWSDFGEDYYWGKNGKKKDYFIARICYEKARQYYIKDHQQDDKNAKRTLKELEKRVIFLLKQEKDSSIDEKDSNENTALHRAAEYKHLKNCARLLFFGASKMIKNAKSTLPLDVLTEEEMVRINILQRQIESLVTSLRKKPSQIIARRFYIHNEPDDKKKEAFTQQAIIHLDSYYDNPAIKPLLDLAKLASLGLHDLSNRDKFKSATYDSDDDCEEKISEQRQFLNISIDLKSNFVGNIVHYNKENELGGLGGYKAHGVYLNNREDPNTIYVGAKRNAPEEFIGTFIHELIHFLAKEVLKNECKPYAHNDLNNKNRFTKIANNLRWKESLDPILSGAFSEFYEGVGQVDDELIVRVGQMIVQYPDDGRQRMQSQAKELWDYYNDVFLKFVIEHVAELQDRALSGWPLEQMVHATANNM
jgi:hypothetical protein